MEKLTILITAGPTREKIDPIRFISNESSGQLGFEIAREAKQRGHRVVLILGPTHLPVIKGIETIHIESAAQLLKAIKANLPKADVLFMSAAVADFTPVSISNRKIKRTKDVTLHLRKTTDILKIISAPLTKKNKIYVGFCLETEDLIKNAKAKLQAKRLDYIVATQYTGKSAPFGDKKFSPTILSKEGQPQALKNISKSNFAKIILEEIS